MIVSRKQIRLEVFVVVHDTVVKTIQEQQLLQPNDVVLVAVSGGPDSVALLHWLNSNQGLLAIQIACAHFNHGFRGAESDEDEQFVQHLCAQWRIPFYAQKANLGPIVEAGGVNLQEVAREHRYRFLVQTAEHIGARRIALAHHRDDQVETILMRLLRGTGATGLTGMPYQRRLSDSIIAIRPFLDVPKEALLTYLKRFHLASRIDSSNLKTDYMRNRVRLQLLPQLQEYNPNVSTALLSLAQMLEEDEAYLHSLAKEHFEKIVRIEAHKKDEITLSISAFRVLPLSLQRRVIKLICNYLNKSEEEVPFIHIESLRNLFLQDVPRQWDLPWSIRVYIRYGEALFKKEATTSTAEPFHFLLQVPTSIQLPTGIGRFSCSVTTKKEAESPLVVYFDYDCISHDLVLRTRKKGDRMWIAGVGGHKKVKDIFIDAKIPREKRDTIPILVAGKEILWIAGVQKSSHGAVNDSTKRYLCCRFEQNE